MCPWRLQSFTLWPSRHWQQWSLCHVCHPHDAPFRVIAHLKKRLFIGLSFFSAKVPLCSTAHSTWFVRFLIWTVESFLQQNYKEGLERRLTLGLADADSSTMDSLQRGRLRTTKVWPNIPTSYVSVSQGRETDLYKVRSDDFDLFFLKITKPKWFSFIC